MSDPHLSSEKREREKGGEKVTGYKPRICTKNLLNLLFTCKKVFFFFIFLSSLKSKESTDGH